MTASARRLPRRPEPVHLMFLKAVCMLCLGLLACKQEDSFASKHSSELRYGCEQSVTCVGAAASSSGEDPVHACIDRTADEVNGLSDAKRQVWLTVFERCAPFQACDYYNCTQSDQAYSNAHLAQIQYDCSQRIACRNALGEMLGDAAFKSCVDETSVMLDLAGSTPQSDFENRFIKCSSMQGCTYRDCN